MADTKVSANQARRILTRKAVVAGSPPAGKARQFEAFKDGDVRFLVCTDVAARGIDLKELPFVINLTLPDDPAQYYHRIGRVNSRQLGLAISIVAVEDNEKVYTTQTA